MESRYILLAVFVAFTFGQFISSSDAGTRVTFQPLFKMNPLNQLSRFAQKMSPVYLENRNGLVNLGVKPLLPYMMENTSTFFNGVGNFVRAIRQDVYRRLGVPFAGGADAVKRT